jgi:hypothetical protein
LGIAFHGRLAADRPAPHLLTRFYLLVSLGGALGGAFVALVAPVVFPVLIEYPLLLILALVLAPPTYRNDHLVTRVRVVRAVLTVLVSLSGIAVFVALPDPFAGIVGLTVVLALSVSRLADGVALVGLLLASAFFMFGAATSTHVERTFFGVHTVSASDEVHSLLHGSTLHGLEVRTDDPPIPRSYFHPAGPVGDIMATAREMRSTLDIGVVGLGTGALAAYGRTEDRLTFYEIDPAVVEIAENPELFRYLTRSAADIQIVVGDGRLRLEESDATHDVIFLDAFSSGSVPTHLITTEAVMTYRKRLAPDGFLVFNISNRNVDLRPVIAALADHHGLSAVIAHDPGAAEEFRTPTLWGVVGPTETIDRMAGDWWTPVDDTTSRRVLWTDSHSDIVRVLRLR